MTNHTVSKEKIGLIAGEGDLPGEVLRNLFRSEFDVRVYSLRSDNSCFKVPAGEICQVKSMDISKVSEDLQNNGISEVIMAGFVPKKMIFDSDSLSAATRSMMSRLPSLDDHTLLGGIVSFFAAVGITVRRYVDLIPELMAGNGVLTNKSPGCDEQDDIEYGLGIMKTILPLSFGQSIVVHKRSVVAVEAMEGTDETILRAGRISSGGVLIKMMRPDQDERYDIPTVGAKTLENMHTAGLTCLALETGRTVILDRDSFFRMADSYGIAVKGIGHCPSL